MNGFGGALRRGTVVVIAMLTLAVVPASAGAKVKMSVKGWTTQGAGTSPDVKNKGKIKNCRTDGANNRRLRFIFKGSGIKKNATIGLTLSRAPDADPDFPYPWPVGPSKTHQDAYGITFGGALGPENIDGDWYATVWLGDKIIARGQVNVKCGNT